MGGDYSPKDIGDIYDLPSLGGGIKITSNDKIELAEQYAQKHLALPAFAGERNVRPFHVAALVNHMTRGTFRPEWVTLMTCRCKEECSDISGAAFPAGTVWRMNGQHTCHARLQMPANYRCPVSVVRYTAETAYDMRMLYASIDRGAARTNRHIFKSYLSGSPAFSGFGVKALSRVPSGLSHWLWGDSSARGARGRDADEVAYLMQTDYYELSKLVLGFATAHGDNENQWLLRAGVVAAMFATFQKSATEAQKFWESVATGVGLPTTSDPRLRLRNILMSTSADGRGGEKKAIGREDYFRYCISAWNAWREGRQIKIFRSPDKRQPLK